MKSLIKIAFSDFWHEFNPETQWFYPLIQKEYDAEIVGYNDNPDILIYSAFGNRHLFSNARIKIYFTGENDVPDFNLCDYAISFYHIDFGSRHLRLPLYALYPGFDILRQREVNNHSFDRKFCSFVVSNGGSVDPIRDEFFHKLSKYRKVDSGGRHLNNIGGPVADKLDFLRSYKFNIAFENSAVDGYTTEKLIDALAAGTIPIYWGNPRVNLDIPSDCFINVSEFKTLDEAVDYVAKVDQNQELYNKYFSVDAIENSPYADWERLFMQFFNHIIECNCTMLAIGGFQSSKKERLMFNERLRNVNFLCRHIDKIEYIAALKHRFIKL